MTLTGCFDAMPRPPVAALVPHIPGEIWDTARNGTSIPTAHAEAALYRNNDFPRFCEAHGFPTGRPVPRAAAALIEAGFHAARGWVRLDRHPEAADLVARALAALPAEHE